MRMGLHPGDTTPGTASEDGQVINGRIGQGGGIKVAPEQFDGVKFW
jgi:hypothetical protein